MVSLFLRKVVIIYVGWRNSELYKNGVSPNKYFDYMLAGKPILNSTNNNKDIIKKIGCGLVVKAESPKEIAEGITYLYSLSREERLAMGDKGRQFVLKEHAISELALRYSNLFT